MTFHEFLERVAAHPELAAPAVSYDGKFTWTAGARSVNLIPGAGDRIMVVLPPTTTGDPNTQPGLLDPDERGVKRAVSEILKGLGLRK